MKYLSSAKDICKWLIPLGVGALLFWLVYRKMDLSSVGDILSAGLRWEWIALYCLLYTASMIFRGLRWQMLLDPVSGEDRRPLTTVLATFIAYGANLLFPRIGEVARCGVLNRYGKMPFSTSLGTVVTERIFDLVCLAGMALAALLLQIEPFRAFLSENPSAGEKLTGLLLSWKLWTAVGVVLLAVVAAILIIRRRPVAQRFKDFFRQMLDGMLSIRTLRRPWLFIVYTLLLWACFYFAFYIGQYFFNIPLGLGFTAMFTGYVMGSMGVVAPVQGGIGAWHFMVIFTLTFYGVGQAEAGTFALVVHGVNTAFTLLSGLVAWGLAALAWRRWSGAKAAAEVRN